MTCNMIRIICDAFHCMGVFFFVCVLHKRDLLKNTVIFFNRGGGVGVRGEVLLGSSSGHFLCRGSFTGPGRSHFSEDSFGSPRATWSWSSGPRDLGAGPVQHRPQHNVVVHYKTLPGPLHTAAAREGPE